MATQLVSNTKAPQVGKYYLVPCVEINESVFVPVMGAAHRDKEHLDFDWLHYHYDWRFIKGSTGRALNVDDLPSNPNIMGKVLHVDATAKTVLKRRKMVRGMPTFPNSRYFMVKLEKPFVGKKALCGNKCPHKGGDLTQGVIDNKGRTICPLHGLAFKGGVCVERI